MIVRHTVRVSDPVVTPDLPVSVYAKRAGLFALLTLPVNALSNLLSRALDNPELARSAGAGYAIASIGFIVFVVAARVLVILFALYSLYNARKAFADLRTGQFAGRGRTVAAVVWDIATILLAAYSLVVLGLQFVAGF